MFLVIQRQIVCGRNIFSKVDHRVSKSNRESYFFRKLVIAPISLIFEKFQSYGCVLQEYCDHALGSWGDPWDHLPVRLNLPEEIFSKTTYLTLVQTLVGYTCKDVEERLLPLSACSRAHLCVHCGQARDPDPILRRKYGAKSTHRGCEQCFDCYKNSTMSWHCTLRIATFVTNKGRKRNENPPTGPQNSQTEF